MINITDLMNTPLKAEIEKLAYGMHYLTITSLIKEDKFETTCNLNSRQMQRLIDNLDTISRKIKDYLAYSR